MHADEVHTDESLVRRLVAAQFPQWARLPVARIASPGTDNAIYRLGSDMAVRMPRIHWAVGQVEKEHAWLPRLAPGLPLAIPGQLGMGNPGEGYPWSWSVCRWLEGEPASADNLADPVQAAVDIARFISALQRIDAAGGPGAAEHGLRGAPLAARDGETRAAIAALAGMFDPAAMTAVWEAALRSPEWNRAPVWFHGDLLPGNVLVERGRVSAVIDFGGLGVGDPACDMMIAWALLPGKARDPFRAALEIDEATWSRGRGHALSQALIFIPYYRETHPGGVRSARRTVEEVLRDHAAGANIASRF